MELPSVYANPIDKKIDNVQEIYKEGNRELTFDAKKYINDIYNSGRILYMISFDINVNGTEFTDKIASKTEDYIITKSNKKIYYRDIKYIKESRKAF